MAEPRNVISTCRKNPGQLTPRDVRYSSRNQLRQVSSRARLWLPLAQYKDTLWERSLGHTWEANLPVPVFTP